MKTDVDCLDVPIEKEVALWNNVKDVRQSLCHRESNSWFFLLVNKGKFEIEINDKNYIVAQGDLLFVLVNQEIGKISETNDFQGSIMLLDYKFVNQILPNRVEIMNNLFYVSQHPVIHLTNEAKYLCLKYFELLNFRMQNPASEYNKQIISSIISSILYEWMGHISRTLSTKSDSRALRQGEKLFKRFIVELMSDSSRTRSVTEYANRLCVTPKYLSAVCKSTKEKTASEIINHYVLKDVIRLLRYSDKSIKEIAQQLGFPNLSFFGKYVKSHLKMSPSAYRKLKS